jgi:hypothetical protein
MKSTQLIAAAFLMISFGCKKDEDKVVPVLTLNGKDTVYVNIGKDYTELGATASDDKDGDITNRIITSGTVNKSTAGTYTINYSVKDNKDNEAKKERKVIVQSSVIGFAGSYNVYEWLQSEAFDMGTYVPTGPTRSLTYTINLQTKANEDAVLYGYNINNLGSSYYMRIEINPDSTFNIQQYDIQQLPNGRGLQIYGNGYFKNDSIKLTHIRYTQALFGSVTQFESGYINGKK